MTTLDAKRALRPIDLARAVGVSTQMVRRYERDGFLPPAERSPAGYRRYTARHVQAVRAARALQGGYGWVTAQRVLRLFHQDDLAGALAAVDAAHAALHRRRQEIDDMLGALRAIVAAGSAGQAEDRQATGAGDRQAPLRVGEAARRAGVRVSALRFWEAQGLLDPRRDRTSRYRLYDDGELLRLRIVVLLRGAGYGFDAIRGALAELGAGRPATALAAVERRRADLAGASRHCAAATAAFWSYVSYVDECGVD